MDLVHANSSVNREIKKKKGLFYLYLLLVKCNTIQFSAVRCSAVQCHAVPCRAVPSHVMQCTVMQCNLINRHDLMI